MSLVELVAPVATVVVALVCMGAMARWRPRWNCTVHGHRMEARYDRTFGAKGPPTIGNAPSGAEAARVYEAVKEQRYVHDVCTACGKTVVRPPSGGTGLDGSGA